ncbi:NAC domain-containing protein 67-like [Papaver somniferum]|uniref:NAC domain-containing protein 67-like n=1 Tax=Papaver somniferum TaxID=3469 RepID=UPI000E705AB0|nr:NAC domain-containing protein 67-like [Papaver somniferum]
MSTKFAPPGYRFNPSDEVIIKHYLIPKIESKPLPSDHIYETTEIYGEAPQDLEETFQEGKKYYRRYAYYDENCDSSLYFFTKLKKRWENGSRISRTAGGGTWTGDNGGKEIYGYPPYKVEKRKLSLTDNAVKGQKRKYLTLTSDGYVTWNMEEYSVEKDDKISDYAIVKITRKKNNNKFSKSSASQTASSCSNYEVNNSELVGNDDFEVHDAVPEVPALEDNQLPVHGQAEPEMNDAQFQDWFMNNTCILFEDEGPVPVIQDAVLPTDQTQQLQSSGDPVDCGVPNLDFFFDSDSLLSAVGPVGAGSFGAIGGDNTAAPDHNQEGTKNILGTISSEAAQPQNESWVISDEELFSGLDNYDLLPDLGVLF